MTQINTTKQAQLKAKILKAVEGLEKETKLSRLQWLSMLVEGAVETAPRAPTQKKPESKKGKVLAQKGAVEGLAHIHLTTRQLAKSKQFIELNPDCEVDVDTTRGERELYYPPSKLEVVKNFLAGCPTGGRKKKFDLSDLKPCISGESTMKGLIKKKPNSGTTQKQKVINQVVEILADQSMTIDEIYGRLKMIGCLPGGAWPKGSLVTYLSKIPDLVTHDKSAGLYYSTSRYQGETEVPQTSIADTLAFETNLSQLVDSVKFVTPVGSSESVESLPVEPPESMGPPEPTKNPSLPGFFPHWARG
jgi:hypothetical protein